MTGIDSKLLIPDSQFHYDPAVNSIDFLKRYDSYLWGLTIEGVLIPALIDAISAAYDWPQRWAWITLQAEQSLVERLDTPPQKALDWAMGYGIEADYDASGNLTGPPNVKDIYRGILNQIIHGIPTARSYFREWNPATTQKVQGQIITTPSAYSWMALQYTPAFERLAINFDLWNKYGGKLTT